MILQKTKVSWKTNFTLIHLFQKIERLKHVNIHYEEEVLWVFYFKLKDLINYF